MKLNFWVFFSICFFLFLIFYCVCFFYILKKEEKNPWLSFIPIVNAFLYLKICKLPFWTLFIPIINIIILFFSPYCIAKQYMLKRKTCILAIIFPFIIFPYLAFSKCRNINKNFNNVFINSTEDIDILESKLVSLNQLEFDDEKNFINVGSKNAEPLDNDVLKNDIIINDEPFIDEYFYEDDISASNKTTSAHDFIEIEDSAIDDLSLNNLDSLEENIVSSSSIEKNLVTEFKEYDSVGPSNEAIAFGGNKKIENFDAVQTKNDNLKCARCGSTLIGADSICPGCGAKIKNT